MRSGGIAWGEPLTVRSLHSISVRSATITSITGRRNATAKLESFPGFEIDEIAARRFAKLTGEINLPPVRFAEVGTPVIYLSHLRPALFAGAMATRAPEGDSHRYYDVGAQLDLNFTVALRLPMVFSVGAAAGWQDGHYRKTELARFAEDHVSVCCRC